MLFVFGLVCSVGTSSAAGAGILYTNIVDPRGPWSIHAIRVPRKGPFELSSVHAAGRAIGLSELSVQATSLDELRVIAAINGDFYQRHGAHAGDPRGLQIVNGELISAPAETASFWIDAKGEPHVANTTSNLKVIWADGSSAPIGLNGNREPDEITLYTPAIGRSTRTQRGRDITLEAEDSNAWLPLRPGRTYKAKVRAVRDGANSELPAGTMVLSIGAVLARQVPRMTSGDVVTISTATAPDLRGAKTAVSGGPIIVQNGKPIGGASWGSWFSGGDEFSSQSRRHPRSAVGWNGDYYWLVEVDGRQRRSAGMTLTELGKFLIALGCTDAMNLDGGGSSTIWYNGRVRNSPCDGGEREIANALVVAARAEAGAQAQARP